LNGLVPSWSPDGRHLAYKRRTINPSRPVEMVVQTLDTGELRTYAPRTGTMGMGQPTWYADGTVQAVNRSGIRLKVGPTDLEEVAVPATLPMGFASPDGRTVYGNTTNSEVPVFDVSTGTRTGSITLPKDWRAGGLSPDGRTFALVNFEAGAAAKLALIGTDGGGFRPIPTSLAGGVAGREAIRSITWSRDGRAMLVAVHTGDDRTSIQRVPVDGGAAITLVQGIVSLRSFAISADERRIAYSTDRPSTDVWTLDLKAALK
jgi:dipeptidyl aminopeptidase/acylaminoacyl peptidase